MTWNSYSCSCLPGPQKRTYNYPDLLEAASPIRRKVLVMMLVRLALALSSVQAVETQTEKGLENEMAAGLCFAKVCMN